MSHQETCGRCHAVICTCGDTWRDENGVVRGTEMLIDVLARSPAAAALVVERLSRTRICVIGEPCPEHGFIHGGEAEELRERFERLELSLSMKGKTSRAREIREILDSVDARDSLAWVEVRKRLEREDGDHG